MTRSPTSGRRDAEEHRPPTHAHGVANRRAGFRAAAALFGVFVIAASVVAVSEVVRVAGTALVHENGFVGSVQNADHSETWNRCSGRLHDAFGSYMWSWSTKSLA